MNVSQIMQCTEYEFKNDCKMFLIGCRERGIVTKWEELQRKLDSRKTVLSSQRDLMAVYTEMDSCATEMALMKVKNDWSML